MKQFNTNTWLVSTRWIGGRCQKGERIDLKYTRAILDAIHNGSLNKSSLEKDSIFNFEVPINCENIPGEILMPKSTWANKNEYAQEAKKLAKLFQDNFKKYESLEKNPKVINTGPKV